MARWEPDSVGRLQQAAVDLFLEHGYADVTVAQIADRAGLTKRTFFNHFTDKREVLFAGAKDFEADVVRHLQAAGAGTTPIDVAVGALAATGAGLARFRPYGQARRALVASSVDLQERELIKSAALVKAIVTELARREVPARLATLTAQAAVAVFNQAFDDWIDDHTTDLHTLMRRSLADLRTALAP